MTTPELPEGGDGLPYVQADEYGDAGEYSGVAGLIQPFPHEMTPSETRMSIMGIPVDRLTEDIIPATQKLR